MIQILIADDHAIVRAGLRQIISENPDMAVSAEAGNGQELLELVRSNPPDVIVLDITMPGRDGLDALKQIKKDHPRLPVLVLSMHPEEHYAVRVLKAGASGYLSKESAPEELIRAILKIHKGRKYISASLAEKLADALEEDKHTPLHECLSDREFQVLCMIANGMPVKRIADALCLSIKTISTYRSRILDKMNQKSNADLTYYAIKNGLID